LMVGMSKFPVCESAITGGPSSGQKCGRGRFQRNVLSASRSWTSLKANFRVFSGEIDPLSDQLPHLAEVQVAKCPRQSEERVAQQDHTSSMSMAAATWPKRRKMVSISSAVSRVPAR